MNFCSLCYIGFITFFVIIYYLYKNYKIQNIVLLIASALFLAVYNLTSMLFFIVTLIFNFIGALYIEKNRKRSILGFFIISDVILLIIGKFTPQMHIWTAVSNRLPIPEFIAPLGISFYTLALIAYLVDVYKKTISADKNILEFALFGSFFPHIVLGPIARYSQIKPQLGVRREFSFKRIESGAYKMLWGFILKMIIADRAGLFVNAAYSKSSSTNGSILLIASLLYAVQIYADFAGCVDIAVGSAKLFGIELTENFKLPYFSTSIAEFWRRWHISLSFWLRDYIYIPLGGNRKGNLRKWINVVIVFIVSGLWHGVGLGFLAWGLLHAFYQIAGAKWKPIKEKLNNNMLKIDSGWSQKFFDMFVTFVLVDFAWIFFRTDNIKKSLSIIKRILLKFGPQSLVDGSLYNFGLNSKSWFVLLFFILLLTVIEVMCYKGLKPGEWIRRQSILFKWAILILALFSIMIFGIYGHGYDAANFIYAQF